MSFLLHVLNANRCSTPVATVFPIPCLCSDFRPVLEGHSDIVFAVHCDEVHQAAPQPGVELLDEFLLPKLLDEVVHLTAPGFAILDGFTGLVVLRLRRFILADHFAGVSALWQSAPWQWSGRYTRPSHPALCHSPENACREHTPCRQRTASDGPRSRFPKCSGFLPVPGCS